MLKDRVPIFVLYKINFHSDSEYVGTFSSQVKAESAIKKIKDSYRPFACPDLYIESEYMDEW